MPAITLGVVEIETRLRVVQRRWNGLALQHAAYVTATLVALAATLLILLALRGHATSFDAIFWLVCVVVVAGSLVVLRRLQRSWLSLEQVARRIDGTAQLDDRLSTLVGCAPQLQRSPLGGILIRQLLTLSPRWAPESIAKRRVARSVWLLVASLCALLATTLFELQSPQVPGPRAAADAGADGSGRPVPVRGLDAKAPAVTVPGTQTGEQTASGNLSRDAEAGNAPGGEHGASAPGEPSENTAGAVPSDAQAAREAQNAEGVPERLQAMIRDALGKEPLEPSRQVARAGSGERERANGASASRPQNDAQHAPETTRNDAATSANGPGQDAQHDGQLMNGHQNQPDADGPQQRGGSQRASGGSGGRGSLFGAAVPEEHGGATRTFELKLSDFGTAMRMESEPQQPKKDTESVPVPAGIRSHGDEAELNQDQTADDPLEKSEIPPEHDTTVRQIFSVRD